MPFLQKFFLLLTRKDVFCIIPKVAARFIPANHRMYILHTILHLKAYILIQQNGPETDISVSHASINRMSKCMKDHVFELRTKM